MESVAGARAAMIEELWAEPSGLAWARRHTKAVDRVVQEIHRRAVAELKDEPELALVATGGYGRKELSPYSDIDLCLVPLNEQHPELDHLIRRLFQDIQREMHARGYRVGYSYRLIADLPGIDATTLSGLLDARLVAGSPQPLELLTGAMVAQFPVAEYLLAKLSERQTALRATHDTPLVIEPNLKDGAGGLRSFQSANWLRQAIGLRAADPSTAYDRVLAARNLLHAAAGRLQDCLTRSRQAEICERLGYDLFEWMADLYTAMVELEQTHRDAVDELREARYRLLNGVYAMRGELRIGPEASLSDAALGTASALELDLHIPRVTTPEARTLDPGRMMQALAGGAKTVRAWDQAGILEELLPELADCRMLMPRDASHAYTVFEHTLRSLEFFDALAKDAGWLGALFQSVQEAHAVRLGLLLHDVGKIDPSRPHAEVGATMAREVCRRWGLERALGETVTWLVENHLLMAKTLRMRDLQHPDTAKEFAATVASPERLTYLTLLTYADIRAVSEETWTPATDDYLHELWSQTQAHFEQGGSPVAAPAELARRAAAHAGGEVMASDVEAFMESLPVHYALTTQPEKIRDHLRLLAEARENGSAIEIEDSRDRTSSEITVVTGNAPGLLGRILGVIYAYDLSLLALRAHTTTAPTSTAIDVFSVSFGGRALPAATARELRRALDQVLAGEKTMAEVLTARGKDPDRRQEIYRYQFLPGNPGILEVQAPRGRGMAFRLARQIAALGWEIHAARVGQWAGQGAAAFYVTGPENRRLEREEVASALNAS